MEEVTAKSDAMLEGAVESAACSDRIASSNQSHTKSMCSLRLLRSASVVLVAVIADLAISGLAQYVSMGKQSYDAPFLVICINHGTTGLACLCILRCKGVSLRQALLEVDFQSLGATIFSATWLGILFFSFNVFWIFNHTSVSIFTTISESNFIFVFALSACIIPERVTVRKCAAVAICLSGVAMISIGGETNTDGATRWDSVLCSLAFTCGGALINVLWGYYFDDAKTATILMVLGLVGSSGLITCLPVIAIFMVTQVEFLVMPTLHQSLLLGSVALSAAFNNFTFMLAISLTSPLILSVGQMLKIPMSIVFDAFVHGQIPTCLGACGMAFVLAGFLVMLLEQSRESRSRDCESP